MQPNVVENRRQGNDPAQHAGNQYGQATRNERDRHVVALAAHGSVVAPGYYTGLTAQETLVF